MSQGRSNIRQPRAPVAAVRSRARRLPIASRTSDNPFRIGPQVRLSAEQWHELGILHEQAHDYGAAIDCYRSALTIEPLNTQVLFDLAFTLAEAGNTDAAIERYRQITEIEPARQDAWVNLSDLLLAVGQTEAGIAALKHAIQLDPADPIARHNWVGLQEDATGR